LLNLPQSSELRRELEPVLKAEHYKGFVVVEPTGRIVASYRNELVGVMLPDQQLSLLKAKAFPVRRWSCLP